MTSRPAPGRIGVAVALACAGAVAACEPPRAPGHHRVAIRSLAFEPARLAVSPGDTITWTNRDIVPHTVTGSGGGWDSGGLDTQESFTMVVGEDRIGAYTCRYHPTMTGILIQP